MRSKPRSSCARVALVSLLTLLAAGCVKKGADGRRSGGSGIYSLGVGASHGRAMAPPTSQRGALTYVRYHEVNGILAKVLLIIGAAPQGKTRVLNSSRSCDSQYCYTSTTYEYTPPSAAEMEQYARTAQATMAGEIPLELSFDVATKSLGGDASGWSFEFLFRSPFIGFAGFPMLEFATGFNYTRYTFEKRKYDFLSGDVSNLSLQEVERDISYKNLGMPLRLMLFVHPRVAAYGQFDMNFFSLMDNDDDVHAPSLARVGALLWLPLVYVKAEVTADGGDLNSVTFGAEAGLEF